MKGVIVHCLEELIKKHYGDAVWHNALQAAGLKPNTLFVVFQDVDDATVMQLITILGQQLHCSLPQLADLFGDYWVQTYSQHTYASFYTRHATAREFLLGLDALHVAMTKTMPNARPPRFDYTWKDEQTLLMKYRSPRNLLDFAIGLIKGVGKFYRQDLEVMKVSPDTLQIVFRV